MKKLLSEIITAWWSEVDTKLVNPKSEEAIKGLKLVLREDFGFDSDVIDYVVEMVRSTPTNFDLGGKTSGIDVGKNQTAVSAQLHPVWDDDEEDDDEDDVYNNNDGELSEWDVTLLDGLDELNEDTWVKHKQSGNVYQVKNPNPEIHTEPSPDEISNAEKSGETKPKDGDEEESGKTQQTQPPQQQSQDDEARAKADADIKIGGRTAAEVDADKESKDGEKQLDKFNPTFDNDSERKMNSMRNSSSKFYDELPNDKQVLFNNAMKRVEVVMSDNASSEQKKQAADWLVKEMGFSTNSNGTKAYLNKLGGFRKILGNGTSATEKLVNNVQSLTDIKQYNASGVKNILSTASKPDLGKENEATPKTHKSVKELFSTNETLSRIREGLHGIYGVMDDNGQVKMPSNRYADEYLKQSFENPALDNTINAAQKLADSGQLDPKFVESLKTHKGRLSTITRDYDIPSEEASEAINQSYNELFSQLHNSDSDAASAVIKQFAENNLYEQELAKGEEVYLPSAGNFPGGDKIRKTDTERIDLVSCKFGKSGRTYGFPANAKAVTQLHPDESKRGRSGQYVGENGSILMINDELVLGNTTDETKQKTTKFIEDNLSEIGLGNVFSKDELSKITDITTQHAENIKEIKNKLKGTKPASLYWDKFGKELQESEDKLSKELSDIISDEQLSKIVGPNNVKNLRTGKGIKPQNLLGAVEISNNIKTSGGYGLSHNKQYFDENGKPKYVTDMGNDNIDDYSITFRDKRTKGRAGGGVQMSFSGDSKQ